MAAFIAACSLPMPGGPVSDAPSDFRAFLDATWQEDLSLKPVFASRVGVKDYQDRWTRVDEAFRRESRQRMEQQLVSLGQFDRASLTPSEQLSFDLFKLDLERRLASDEYRHHKFVIHQHRGPHTRVPSHLINIHQITDVQDAEDYIARLRNVGTYFDGVIEQLDLRTQKGLFLADWQYPRMVQSARNVITGRPFDTGDVDSSLWEDFNAKLAGLDIDEATRDRLVDDARRALREDFAPAYEKLITALEAQSRFGTAADGVWKFPEGDAFYAERLRWYTTTDLTADEVHEIGLREVSRIHEQMREIMRQVNFAGDLPDFFAFIRNDPQFYFPNTEEGRAAYLEQARSIIAEMDEALPSVFGLLPKAPITVKRVEAFRERSAGRAFYQSPPSDGSRPGIYYANLYDMSSMPKYQMAALAFHEGVPGHHMQRAISVELTEIPEFQKYASFTAYTEGWGLYSEALAGEMGFYRDPYSDFGRLSAELWRACRLVVDTGLHSKRWTREQATAYLVENTPNSESTALKAIERYIAQPGQATAYMIGKLKLMELRSRAKAAMGDDFDLRDFHDAVLEDGPVPLSILEDKIERDFILR
ncbi:MAG: DUF885 domain-containing protein [Congregibacter sp.]